MTLKKAFLRGLMGAPIGVFIGYTITIILSLIWANGWYASVVPELTAALGSEIAAVCVQYLFLLLYGFTFGAASAVWEAERWNLARQTGIHCLLVCGVSFPIAWFCRWMAHNLKGILCYAGAFLAVYAILWLILTAIARRDVKKVNQKLKKH